MKPPAIVANVNLVESAGIVSAVAQYTSYVVQLVKPVYENVCASPLLVFPAPNTVTTGPFDEPTVALLLHVPELTSVAVGCAALFS